MTALRSLPGFPARRGLISEWQAHVLSVASWRLSGQPRALEPGQVAALPASCDLAAITGRRDLALARLGLRAGRVVALTLEGIGWRAGGSRSRARAAAGAAAARRRWQAIVGYMHAGRPEPFVGNRASGSARWEIAAAPSSLRPSAPCSAAPATATSPPCSQTAVAHCPGADRAGRQRAPGTRKMPHVPISFLLRLVASSACVRTVRSNPLAPSSVKETGHGERQSPGGAMRRSVNAMAAAVLVPLMAGGCSSAVVAAHHARAAAERRPSSPTARAAAVTDAGLPRCAARSLALGLGPFVFVSPMTGEEATLYTLTNRGSGTCTLRGYPRVVFYDASGAGLPFRYARGGREYVTAARPVTVVLARGASAYVLVAKYRCDIGIARSAAAMRLTLPAAHGATFAGRQPTGLPYCRGGRQDPGQTIRSRPSSRHHATSSAP